MKREELSKRITGLLITLATVLSFLYQPVTVEYRKAAIATAVGVALAVGGAAKVFGGWKKRKAKRRAQKKEAKYQKALAQEQARYQREMAEFQKESALETMEKELAMGMETEYEQMGEAETQLLGQSAASYQQTYIGQLAAEQEYTQALTGAERAMGDIQAQQASSGAKEDITLQTIINSEIQQNLNAQRTRIDKGLSLSDYQTQLGIRSAKVEIDRLGRKYEPNSAFMNLYNYKRERVTGETAIQLAHINTQEALQTSYLDSIIKANKAPKWDWETTLDIFTTGVDVAAGIWG
jgi:uncharacterized membrane protein YccC